VRAGSASRTSRHARRAVGNYASLQGQRRARFERHHINSDRTAWCSPDQHGGSIWAYRVASKIKMDKWASEQWHRAVDVIMAYRGWYGSNGVLNDVSGSMCCSRYLAPSATAAWQAPYFIFIVGAISKRQHRSTTLTCLWFCCCAARNAAGASSCLLRVFALARNAFGAQARQRILRIEHGRRVEAYQRGGGVKKRRRVSKDQLRQIAALSMVGGLSTCAPRGTS